MLSDADRTTATCSVLWQLLMATNRQFFNYEPTLWQLRLDQFSFRFYHNISKTLCTEHFVYHKTHRGPSVQHPTTTTLRNFRGTVCECPTAVAQYKQNVQTLLNLKLKKCKKLHWDSNSSVSNIQIKSSSNILNHVQLSLTFGTRLLQPTGRYLFTFEGCEKYINTQNYRKR